MPIFSPFFFFLAFPVSFFSFSSYVCLRKFAPPCAPSRYGPGILHQDTQDFSLSSTELNRPGYILISIALNWNYIQQATLGTCSRLNIELSPGGGVKIAQGEREPKTPRLKSLSALLSPVYFKNRANIKPARARCIVLIEIIPGKTGRYTK